MKILAVADEESEYLYDHYAPGKLDGVELIIACGDLKSAYLEFLVTMANCPLVYIHGNHDDSNPRDPEGCISAENRVVVVNGLRIAGLGGSFKYKDGKYMFTEKQMNRRMKKLRRSIRKNKGVDIFISHAPARNLNDFDTITHRGFECFNMLLSEYEPKYFFHGHIHQNYGANIPRKTEHGKTTVINAYDHYIMEI